LFLFFIDRFSKLYVIYLDRKYYNEDLFVSKYLNINLIWNEGVAFGLFSFDQTLLYNVLTIIILVLIFAIFIMMIKNVGLKKYALIMIFSGAIGNVYDRIIFRAVPDFIDCHVGDFHWFIFNAADIFITIGVIFMILFELIDINKKNHEQI
jgi:signal peptidase II